MLISPAPRAGAAARCSVLVANTTAVNGSENNVIGSETHQPALPVSVDESTRASFVIVVEYFLRRHKRRQHRRTSSTNMHRRVESRFRNATADGMHGGTRAAVQVRSAHGTAGGAAIEVDCDLSARSCSELTTAYHSDIYRRLNRCCQSCRGAW